MTQPYNVPHQAGSDMYQLIEELFPICRSITGNGFRESLRRVAEIIPLSFTEVPSGTSVFDWNVPLEWNIREAWIADASGRRIVDFQNLNLHVVNYSVPIRRRMALTELKPHLHTLPGRPDAVPYRTSYYKQDWGFCMSQRTLDSLPDGDYDVCIDSTLAPGSLTYAECVLPGTIPDEILVSVHSCHPSLANDNLSGMAVATFLARYLANTPRHHTFRFLFIPGTIGSITWLAQHESDARRIRHGLVFSCLGDSGKMTYKRSRRGNALVDRAAANVLRNDPHELMDFVPYGYDERQYCSPGFNLPVGCLTRTPNGRFPEYHTSDDNLGFVKPECLADSLRKALAIIEILEHDTSYVNLSPKCEPQLGKRGLYRNTGGTHPAGFEMALLWVLNFSDGQHSLLDISDRSSIPFSVIKQAADALVDAKLLDQAGHESSHVGRDRPQQSRTIRPSWLA
ncbi:MAG TPA: DUF4910 domain-containing protein [Gemmatimonadaceae bacterium]|nr:DUF4910 domain-containing protein [Gemmatimonadaceae bacterium]